VFDDTAALAFLDRRPVFPGHVLIVPRDHVQTLADLPVDQVAPLFQRVQLITAAVESALAADGSFVAMNNRVSQSVPHLHVHVVPRRRGDGLRGFFWPRRKYAAGEAEAVADQIRVALAPPVSQ
jgi:histidine triad (HIT) family protein